MNCGDFLKQLGEKTAMSKEELNERLKEINAELEKTVAEEPDMVNHPPHYTTANGLETIDVIEAFTADLKGIEAVDTANVIKYICRWKNKNGLQDLQKAKWYLEHLIKYIEKESN